MFRPATLRTFGWFDTNFKPAYFEANDYYARVVLGGGRCRVVHGAQCFHHGPMTVRIDPAAAHHVNHWFGLNRQYFSRKWGVQTSGNSAEEVVGRYYRHPFNDPLRPITRVSEKRQLLTRGRAHQFDFRIGLFVPVGRAVEGRSAPRRIEVADANFRRNSVPARIGDAVGVPPA
jgi:hypothetical protein